MIIDRDFLDHWKTVLVAQTLGDAAPLGLLRLWAHCEARRDDTFALTPVQLAAITRISASPIAIEGALTEARWIEREGDKIRVLGWSERNAKLLARIKGGKARLAGADRLANGQLAPSYQPASGQLSTSYHAGSTSVAGAEERRVEESRIEPPPYRADPALEGVSGESLAALEDTAAFLIALLAKPGKKSRAKLSREAEGELARQAEALPLTDSQKAMLTWFYGLPADSEDLDLRTRYRDANALATNLFTALERAEAYAEKGHAPSAAASTEKKSRAPWPDQTREWFAHLYGSPALQAHEANRGDWWDLPESVRSEFELAQKGAR